MKKERAQDIIITAKRMTMKGEKWFDNLHLAMTTEEYEHVRHVWSLMEKNSSFPQALVKIAGLESLFSLPI